MKMIFVSNNWADAHQQTRLKALLNLGFSILGLAVFRDYYPSSSLISPICIGEMEHASYKKRIGVYFRLCSQVLRHAENDDWIYVFGFDLMLVTLITKVISKRRFKIIYEIPDIRELFFCSTLGGKLIRWIEKIAIPHINLLVVTSPEFISDYFIQLRKISVPDYLVIENKIHILEVCNSFVKPEHTISANNRKIRIGYFGVLRCSATLDCLIALAGKNQFDIILRGIFMPATKHYEDIIHHLDFIHYLGPYKVPEDLPAVYSDVDVVWAAYPFSASAMGNHLFARTNRFYESLFFKKPFIVQKGTADANKAEFLGNIAIVIDLKNMSQTIEDLLSQLNPDHLRSLQNMLYSIPESHYKITSEYKNLVKCL